MASSKMLLVFITLCSILQSIVVIKAACVCNEPGVDHCAPCNENIIVRPKPKPYGPPLPLPPIGDKCYCNSLRVEPAALPKTCDKHNTPYCKCKTKPPKEQENPLYNKSPPAYDTPIYNNPPPNYYAPPAPPVYDSPAADPVSISLAIQAGKAIGVPEAKLAFGFVQKPLDGLPKIQFSDVPEENLFKLKNEVITLKKAPYSVQKPEEELLLEDELEDDVGYDGGIDLKLNYKQLGYQTEHFINPKFRNIVPAYTYATNPNYQSYTVKPVYAKTKVDCGFKPGRVAPGEKENCNCNYKAY